ncbi:MAG: NRAMP family divalent metal transporter [Actinomycetota bacterium]
MKRLLEITLGVLVAIGAFVDIGDFVASSAAGSRFELGLAWVILLGTFGIILFAEMAGRVATLSHRGTFDLVRERMGPRLGGVTLIASFLVNFLTLAAEVGGLALVVELLTGLNYLFWIVPLGALVWIVMWRVKFSVMERMFGLTGLALLVTVVGVWHWGPDWHQMFHSATHPFVPNTESKATYWYWAVSLLGATITVYEPFFFSSGAIEEKWGRQDLMVNRANVYLGFPLGAIISLAIMVLGSIFLFPRGISSDTLSQAALPITLVFGKIGLALLLIGAFAAFFGAAIETGLSAGYIVAQYFGWPWGKMVKPKEAPRFHLVVLLTLVAAIIVVQSTANPIKVTEYAIALVAVAAPLTYLPILLLANDPRYVGDKTNTKLSNALASAFFVVLVVASAAAIPLLIITKGGA